MDDSDFKKVNEGIGQGMSYRGRVLLEINTAPMSDRTVENSADGIQTVRMPQPRERKQRKPPKPRGNLSKDPLDYQIRIHVIQGRALQGQSIDPVGRLLLFSASSN